MVFTREFLLDVRRRAIRKRVWYRCLDDVDRGIFYLVTRVVDRIESGLLGSVLVKMLKRLRDAMKSEFARHIDSFGYGAARRVAGQAFSFGSKLVSGWARDLSFIRYLTMMDLNRPSGWGIH